MSDLTLDQIQEIGFSILLHTAKVMSTLEISYILDFGTLLGAIRHGGFIPWDDDIDISIASDSLQRFVQQGQALLPDYLAIGPNPALASAIKVADTRFQIRVNGLTPNEIMVEHPAVDIFVIRQYRRFAPLLPTRLLGRLAAVQPSAQARSIAYRRSGRRSRSLALKALKTTPRHVLATYSDLVQVNRQVGWNVGSRRSLFGHEFGSGFGPEYLPTETIFPLREVTFGENRFLGPNDPDAYLTSMYGDWRTPPPPDAQTPSHIITAQ